MLHALARAPGHPLSAAYRRRFALPGPSTVQKALEALERDELVARSGGFAEISEPFLAEWIERALGGLMLRPDELVEAGDAPSV